MTYGAEVVILIESGFPTLRTDQFNIEENNHLLSANLNLVEERKEVVAVKMAHYQQRFKNRYDKGVKLMLLGNLDPD